MFHLKFKHTWHLKGNRLDSMHWTFSKDSGNLRKQKPMAFYLLKLIGHEKSQNHSVFDACPHNATGKAAPAVKTPGPTLLKDHFPFYPSPMCWSTYKLERERQADYRQQLQRVIPSLNQGINQQLCQHSTLPEASMGATVAKTGLRLPAPTSDCRKENNTHLFQTASKIS